MCEGRIQMQHRAHGPNSGMEKGPFAHQSGLDMWIRVWGGKM